MCGASERLRRGFTRDGDGTPLTFSSPRENRSSSVRNTENVTTATQRNHVKMSEFAQRAGVPIPTIKHYVREGLLPQPLRTAKNMAFYDLSFVPHVRVIKRLQTEHYLPLDVIRQLLDEIDGDELPEHLALEATVARVVAAQSAKDTFSRRQAVAAGLSTEELDALQRLGLVSAPGRDGVYRDGDAGLLRLVAQARRAGITEAMVPTVALRVYFDALADFVRAEVEFFRAGMTIDNADRIDTLAETATRLSEKLMVLMRRKLLLPMLRENRRER